MPTKELASIPPFSSLPPKEIEHLETTFPSLKFQAGKILFREGHSDDKFYILLEGQVEIVKSLDNEEERILGIREAGNLLGEMSLFSRDGCHTASVRSLTPLVLLKVPHKELDALLHRQPQLAYELIRLFSIRLEESENSTILDLREKNQRLLVAYEELKAAQEQIIEKERLEKELEISGEIQKSILPERLPESQGYEFGALMIPARRVGGDFYTFFKMGRNRLGIVVGDVSDKGVPAALYMALTYSLIRAEAVRTDSPVQAFRKVNQHLLQMNSSNMFVTLVYGILEYSSGDFHFARAAHPSPLILDGEGRIVEVPVSTGQPLGLFDDIPIDEQHVQIPPGGTLLLYSDGVNETANIQGDEFGVEMLSRIVTCSRTRPAQEICGQLWQAVQSHGEGIPQQDDFTTVVVKRLKTNNHANT
jgi:sigma-B regulation protein RsbU (phosphoserine phosphatase)